MDYRAGEVQVRLVGNRIGTVEKHLSDICQGLSSYLRKLSSTRDKGDELAKCVLNFAENEKLNLTTQTGLLGFADNLATLQDYRTAEIERIDARVVQNLFKYGSICKQAKEDLRNNFSAQTRELTRKNHLDKVRERYPTNWQTVTKAENDFMKASTESALSSRQLENHIEDFEEQKIKDVKAIFLDLANIEIMFHAKALEIYTAAWNNIASIDEDKDLENFRNCLRSPYQNPRLSTVRSNMFRSAPDLSSLNDFTEGEAPPLDEERSLKSQTRRKKLALHRSSRSLDVEVKDTDSSDNSDLSIEEIGSSDRVSKLSDHKTLRK